MSVQIAMPGGQQTVTKNIRVLAVDDDALNLEVLNHILVGEGYEVENASGGEEALSLLTKNGKHFDLVLLDRMMPNIDGMQVLQQIKQNAKYSNIPVIMQTAAVNPMQVIEGIEAGAYYYLTKPFDDEMLVSIVHAAARDSLQQNVLQGEMDDNKLALDMIVGSEFEFRTLEQAQTLAAVLANYFPEPSKVVIGLSELMVNAVEHGNLAIGYQTKNELVTTGDWEGEIKRRLSLEENKGKVVKVKFKRDRDKILVSIRDMGNGFKWQDYIDFDPIRMTDPNGRGIAKANIMAFDNIEYLGCGNEVVCCILLKNKGK